MELARCLRYAPLVAAVVVGAAGLAGPAPMAAGDPRWVPGPCPPTADGRRGGSSEAGAWFHLDPVLDDAGTLAGQRLTMGTRQGPTRTLPLPPESFASGPVGGLVLVGDDDGTSSRLRLMDPDRGCEVLVAEEAAVIRSAVQVPGGTASFEHRVDRSTRADLGVWRRSGGGGSAVRVLGPMPVDDAFGPTFVTDVRISGDGRLVATSCGQRSCRTRVQDPVTQRVARVDATGPVLGVHGERLIARAACAGYPCPILARDLDGTGSAVIVGAAGEAVLGGADEGLLVYEDGAGEVRTRDLRTSHDVAVGGGGLRPVPVGSLARSGSEAPPGAVVLAPGGTVADARSIRLVGADGRGPLETQEVAR